MTQIKQLLNAMIGQISRDDIELLMIEASKQFDNGYFDWSIDGTGIVFIVKYN